MGNTDQSGTTEIHGLSGPQDPALDTRPRHWQLVVTGNMGGHNRSADLEAITDALAKALLPLQSRGIYLQQSVIRSGVIVTAPDALGTPMELEESGAQSGDSPSASSSPTGSSASPS